MSNQPGSTTVLVGGAILLVLGVLYFALPASDTTISLRSKDPPKAAKTAELGGDVPDEARDALYPETVILVGRDGKTFWTPVDRWRGAHGAGARFRDEDSIDVDDGAGKKFKLTGKEVNALIAASRFGITWQLHGPRRKIE